MSPTAPRIARVVVMVAALAMIPIAAATRPHAVPLHFYYSPDAAGVLDPAIAAFNDEHGAIEVIGHVESSGNVESAIATGNLEPEMWMPASSIWARLLSFDSEVDPVPASSPSFFYSPEVFATWAKVEERTNRAYGEPMGWGTLAMLNEQDLREGRDGPLGDVTPFRFGHTRPTTSTSGLYAMVSQYAAAVDVPPDDLTTTPPMRVPDVIDDVRAFELSVRNYGDVASDFCGPLALYAEQSYSALYMQETTLQKCRADGAPNLLEVYPSEGSFVADYPLVILDAAWVDEQERSAAATFSAWLGDHLSVDAIVAEFLRAGSPWDDRPDPAPSGADDAHGAFEVLPIPTANVLAQARASWSNQIRKVGHIVMVLDHSSDMASFGRWASACDLLRSIVLKLDPRNHAGLYWFDDRVHPVVAPGRVEDVAVPLSEALDPRSGSPSTVPSAVLSDAVWQASHLGSVRAQDAIDILLVVSTGHDDSDAPALQQVLGWLRTRSGDRSPIQVFTVHVGGGGKRELIAMAEAGRGVSWSLTGSDPDAPEDIRDAILSLVPTDA